MKAMEKDWYKKNWTLDIQNVSWVEDTASFGDEYYGLRHVIIVSGGTLDLKKQVLLSSGRYVILFMVVSSRCVC